MQHEARAMLHRLNPNFNTIKDPGKNLSGGQRQSVAIASAILFNAKILIMDEPTAAPGPQETAMVAELMHHLKKEGIGIFVISHDLHDVFDLSHRVSVMTNARLVGSRSYAKAPNDQWLGLRFLGNTTDRPPMR